MRSATEIGAELTRLRKERGQSRTFVARTLGIPYTTMSSYEYGIRSPSDRVKSRLSEYYGVPIGKLFFAEEHHET